MTAGVELPQLMMLPCWRRYGKPSGGWVVLSKYPVSFASLTGWPKKRQANSGLSLFYF